jgi:hypothetical protein
MAGLTTIRLKRKPPPKKQPGQGLGPRTMAGSVLDLRSASHNYGGTEKQWRAGVARRVIPFRRFGGRIVFLKHELDEFFSALPGVTLSEARANMAERTGEAVTR